MKMLIVASSLVLLNACATMMQGRNETISVDSRPSGAAATIACDGGVSVSGTTPARLVIPRRADHCVVSVTDGTRTGRQPIERGPGGKYWANFGLVGGFGVGSLIAFTSGGEEAFFAGAASGIAGGLGFIIDRLTGAMYDRDVHEVTIDLER